MTPSISDKVVIMTRDELEEIKNSSFQRGVRRGRFEESYARSNSAPPGQVGHSGGAVDSHEHPIPDRTAAPSIHGDEEYSATGFDADHRAEG